MTNIPLDVVHVGFPKNASTYLQHSGLKLHPEVNFSWAEHKAPFFDLITHPFGYDSQEFRDRLTQTPFADDKANAKVRVFSQESLSGDSFNGLGARDILDRLARDLPGVKLLIILREQHTYIASVYNAYIMEGGTLSIRDFLTVKDSPAVNRSLTPLPGHHRGRNSIYDKLQYDRYVSYAQNLFGRDKVKVMFLENLQRDRRGFLSELYIFLGVDPDFDPPARAANTSFKPPWFNLMRLGSRFCITQHNFSGLFSYTMYRRLRNMMRLLSDKLPMGRGRLLEHIQATVPAWALEDWRKSNARLAALTETDLKALGFKLPKADLPESDQPR